MSEETIKSRSEGTTYGVIHRLGLKYVSRGHARPTFTAGSLAAKLWDEMFDVFDKFRQSKHDRMEARQEARQEILSLVEKYGPGIWGANRVNVVSYTSPQYPEYHKDLIWDDDLETQKLYFIPS
jgi:hypothetical protein